MFGLFVLTLTSAVSMTAADAEASRAAYSNCLTDYTIEQLDQKTAAKAFNKAAVEACPKERAALIDTISKDEISYGSSAAEAAEYATEEANGVLSSFAGSYTDFLESNTRPSK